MNCKIWKNTIVGVIAAFSVTISVDYAVAQTLDEAQRAADKAQYDAEAASREAEYAQKDADQVDAKSTADKAAETADRKAEQDEQAARKAQDKADQSLADVNANKPDSARKAANDQEAADKARDQAQKSEDAAEKADKKADKQKLQLIGENQREITEHKINRERQRDKRKYAEEAWKKQRELNRLKALTLGPTAHSGTSLAALTTSGKLTCTIAGTGEVIGTVANLTVQNLTGQPLDCSVPPTILESISGKNQPYACPKGQTVALGPHEAKTVPINGVCLNRNKPPVGKGVTGDLAMNTGDPNVPQNPGSHIPAKQARDLLRICTAINEAAEKLQKDGALKDIPYRDPQEKIKIAEQWSTWCNPRISEITGAPPATKEDLRKVVYKQLEAKGPMTPATKKKVDQGINAIFEEGVKLTTEEAKNREKPAPAETTGGQGEGGNNPPPGTANVSDEREGVPGAQGTPPQTQEQPEKKSKWPQPVQDWIAKKKAANGADRQKQFAQEHYDYEKDKFFKKHEFHEKLKKQSVEAEEKAKAPGHTPQDKDNSDKAKKELAKNEAALEKDFLQTKEGEKANEERYDAKKAADYAHDVEQAAGKNIDPGIKDEAEKAVQQYEQDRLEAGKDIGTPEWIDKIKADEAAREAKKAEEEADKKAKGAVKP